MGDDGIRYRIGTFDNPLFRRYFNSLPETECRILCVPGDTPANDRHIIATRTGNEPAEVKVVQAPQEKGKTGGEHKNGTC